jgi:hypothetical protein
VAEKGQNFPKRAGGSQSRPRKHTGPKDVAEQVGRDLQAQYGSPSRAAGAGTAAARQDQAHRRSDDLQDFERLAQTGDDSALLPYTPTPSTNPPRPRTMAAGYDSQAQVVTVKFREGAVYQYYGVPQNVWRNFRRVKSPGKFINRTLNNFDYTRRSDLES